MVGTVHRHTTRPADPWCERHRRAGVSSLAMPDRPPLGKLKIFLGYAAGVGKTYQMLEEAQEEKRQGVDVVVGYFRPLGRKAIIAKNRGLYVIPRRKLDYRGGLFEEIDT